MPAGTFEEPGTSRRQVSRTERNREGISSAIAPGNRFLAYTFPSRSPRPTSPALPGRRDYVEAAPTLPNNPWIGLPPASPPATTTKRGTVFHLHPQQQHLVAHPKPKRKVSPTTVAMTTVTARSTSWSMPERTPEEPETSLEVRRPAPRVGPRWLRRQAMRVERQPWRMPTSRLATCRRAALCGTPRLRRCTGNRRRS